MNSFAQRCVVCGFVLAMCAPGCTNAELPVAPAPREGQTKTEKMVGKWKWTQIRQRKVPGDWELIWQFHANGNYFFYTKDDRPARSHEGTYKIDGDSIRCHTTSDDDGQEASCDLVIVSVSDTEAVISAPSGKQKLLLRLERLPVK